MVIFELLISSLPLWQLKLKRPQPIPTSLRFSLSSSNKIAKLDVFCIRSLVLNSLCIKTWDQLSLWHWLWGNKEVAQSRFSEVVYGAAVKWLVQQHRHHHLQQQRQQQQQSSSNVWQLEMVPLARHVFSFLTPATLSQLYITSLKIVSWSCFYVHLVSKGSCFVGSVTGLRAYCFW